MEEPTEAQLRKLYELCYTLANVMFQPPSHYPVGCPNRKTIPADDPEWQQKVIASIKRQIGETVDNGDQPQS